MSAKPIMVMGTMSSAGKSFLAAGLCRLFRQDGMRTAPFKSQNMALNSYITQDGLEMGRAQVMQAEAAGIVPDVRMNPILLKPTGEKSSQVIVNGEVCDTLSAQEYYRRKRDFLPHIRRAYDSLAAEYDVIVLEGAGSPAEINLRDVDVVNMGMAEIADAPVILVGDIDRGGVFASVYGTIALLTPQERARIRGIVINKFRGDKEILQSGLTMLEQLTGVPVLGVLPYLPVTLDDEDSLSDQLLQRQKQGDADVDIAVIRFPRISNFTDFDVFFHMEHVSLRYVTRAEELGEPDMLILPGTKSTMSDLRWLRQNGLEARLLRQWERGCPIFGICGGYQMLGRCISDPAGVEESGSVRGIGLLDTETVFAPQKHRARTSGHFSAVPGMFHDLSGKPVSGYEIHMGETSGGSQALPFVIGEDGTVCGHMDETGQVCGTYLHGLFDAHDTAQKIIQAMLSRKGESAYTVETFDLRAYKEMQYDRLADALREHLDIDRIYRILHGEDTL